MSEDIRLSAPAPGVRRITVDRAPKRNALTRAMMQALCDLFLEADADDDVRAILLDTTGPVFCAGADLDGLAGSPLSAADDPGHQCLLAMAGARKPVVAAVQGAAVGMGATMLLHCDLVFAGPRASLRTPFVELGLTPEGGATFLLPAIGHARAARLLMLAEALNAQEAKEAGLVTQVVAEDALIERASAAAARLAAMPPIAMARTKAMLRAPDLIAIMDAEQVGFRESVAGSEFRQAVDAARARLAGQNKGEKA